jgi:DNA-binding XRE family transcriptional regulator
MEMHENKNVAEAKTGEHEQRENRAPEASTPSGETNKEAREQHGKAGAKPKTRKNNLRKLRLEKMMSKAELARRAGVSTLTIDRVERGLSCRMDTKRKILEALGLKPSDRVTVFGEDE